jgi:hypothetical protein
MTFMIFLLYLTLFYFPWIVIADFIPIPLTFDDDGRYLMGVNTVQFTHLITETDPYFFHIVGWFFPAVVPTGTVNEPYRCCVARFKLSFMHGWTRVRSLFLQYFYLH